MKNKRDYIYEYSDLNLFQTRVKILKGEYSGIILEFGGSKLIQSINIQDFNFTYTLYEIPENLKYIQLNGDVKFERFLSKLLISIIKNRRKDKTETSKLATAASVEGCVSEIKIDEKFYNKPIIPTNTTVMDF
jgi:hypothetical protein